MLLITFSLLIMSVGILLPLRRAPEPVRVRIASKADINRPRL